MTLILLSILALMLPGCAANPPRYEEICVNGVTYYEFPKGGVFVGYVPHSAQIKTCDNW